MFTGCSLYCCSVFLSLQRAKQAPVYTELPLSKSNEFIQFNGESSGSIYTNVHFVYAFPILGLQQAGEKWWGVIVHILLPFWAVGILVSAVWVSIQGPIFLVKELPSNLRNYSARVPGRNRSFLFLVLITKRNKGLEMLQSRSRPNTSPTEYKCSDSLYLINCGAGAAIHHPLLWRASHSPAAKARCYWSVGVDSSATFTLRIKVQ